MDDLARELRALARERLPAKRYLHTLGTEKEAVTLAMRYGQDVCQARCAALLHDITKPEQNQLKLCAEYGIILPEFERGVPKLLHALTAEAYARGRGLPQGALDAIRWHTTGRAGMSVLEKILYVADSIEPFRKPFEGLPEMRRLAYVDLDGAAALGLRLTVREHLAADRDLHPASLEALEELTETGAGE
ncbi:MAG: bis(5'-nucleosyl)-tetraphosphatase (symmetrical) YqeK [Oscillospiraceae bacterium]|nr:bis(5'-nucleosyl)-tetraphosphatase (symmetrical) YqeK [Oscillospiraceae bacterium]